MGSQERKLREKEALKQSMLSAAINIAKCEGWQAVTIRKIADAIDYSAPIVYEHFTNKEDLIAEIIHQGYKQMLGSFREVVIQNMTPDELLLEISLKHWDFAMENKVLFQLMFSLEREHPRDDFMNVLTAIRNTFAKTTHKEGPELDSIIFNWVCLMSGTITTLMLIEEKKQKPPHELNISPKELYRSFILRFLKSIHD